MDLFFSHVEKFRHGFCKIYREKIRMFSSFQNEYVSVRKIPGKILRSLDWHLCLEQLSSLVSTSPEKRLISNDIADLKSPELETANSFTLSSHAWKMKHQMKLQGDLSKTCKDAVDAKGLSSANKGTWTEEKSPGYWIFCFQDLQSSREQLKDIRITIN